MEIAIILFFLGKNDPECNSCGGDPDKKCHSCSCRTCGGKQEPNMQLLCDECNMAYHIYCLDPPLEKIPEEEYWYAYHEFLLRLIRTYIFEIIRLKMQK